MTDPAPEVAPLPRRRRWWWAVAVAALIGVGAIALRPAPQPRRSGTPAPAFVLPDLRRPAATVSLAQYRGRPVVVNFWASWCVPCRRELPAFRAAYARYGKRIAFVGVNHQDSRAGATKMFDEFAIRYPSGYDPDGNVAQAYRLIGMPTTIFIDGDGRIVSKHTGELSRTDLDTALAELLDRKPRPSPTVVGRFGAVHASVCRAAGLAGRGDLAGAQRLFTNEAHARLHVLAADVASRDRATAARLLVGKEAVEAGWAKDAASQSIALRALADATSTAIAAMGEPRPAPCPQTGVTPE